MPVWMSMSFQESYSENLEGVLFLHELFLVMFLIIYSFSAYSAWGWISSPICAPRALSTHEGLEIFWTLGPSLFLFILVVLSVQDIYFSECSDMILFGCQVTASQWYWSYEFCFKSEDLSLSFDSYMSDDNSVLWTLEVDNRLGLLYGYTYQMYCGSMDVIHSWSIPSLSVKMDAVPGRVNELEMKVSAPGVYFGQCSEICGAYHSFMPIAVEAGSPCDFLTK